MELGMEEVVREHLRQAELKKAELKQSLDTLSAQSSSFLEVSVRLNVVDAYFDSVVKIIERKKDEAVSEIRVREEAVEKRAEEVRVREEKFRDFRRRDLGQMREKERGLEEWERELEKREKRVKEMEKRVKEMEEEVEKRREELRIREERVEDLRSGIFVEIHKKKMVLKEREREFEMRVEETERGVEERAMRLEEERTRLVKGIEDSMKTKEWWWKRMDHRIKVIDDKVKEVEARELNVEEEKKAVEIRAAELEMKEKDMEKEFRDMKRALNYLVEEVEGERNDNSALREEVSLLTQKLELMAKSSDVSGTSREEESVANQLGVSEVPSTSNTGTTPDGRTLQMYINVTASNDDSWQDEVETILQRLPEPAKIVLDAMEGFYPPHLSIDGKQFDSSTVRKTCICLLRTLNSLSPSVNPVLRDDALKLAFKWKQKMTVTAENPLEVTGFLELVMTYGLTTEFKGFELLKLSKVAYGESTPLKLLQDLGCADSISPRECTSYRANSEFTNTKTSNIAYVKHLINENQRHRAVEYICEFDLEDYFPISTMVEIHINHLRQNSRKLLKEKGNTAAVQKEAAESEIAGLKDLIKCIGSHKLQDRYPPASLNERIAQLERQLGSKKRAAPSMNSSPHLGPCINARPSKTR